MYKVYVALEESYKKKKKNRQQRFVTEYMKYITFCGFAIKGSSAWDEKQFLSGILSGMTFGEGTTSELFSLKRSPGLYR